jgi:putative transposase
MERQRNPLERIYGRGDLHFVTFSCYSRRPYLGSALARERFLKILDEVRCRHKFKLVGYVIMPEHVHLLISEPLQGNPSKVLQVLKQKASQSLRQEKLPSYKLLAFSAQKSEPARQSSGITVPGDRR